MRSKEQFKTYVYEKADAVHARNKHLRMVWTRGMVAFSLLVVVGGVFIHSDKSFWDAKMVAPAAENEIKTVTLHDGCIAETIAPSVAYGVLADDANAGVELERNVEDSSEESADLTVSKTDCVFYYSTVCAQNMIACTACDFVIAEDASAYTGTLTGIDFSKNIALVFTAQSEVKGWDIEYGDDVIVITLTYGEKSVRNTSYTVLLDRSKYSGQDITILCQ